MATTTSTIVNLSAIVSKTADKDILKRVARTGIFRGLPFRLYAGDIISFSPLEKAKIKVIPTRSDGDLIMIFVTLTRGDKVTSDFECPIWALRKACYNPSDPDGYNTFRTGHPIYEGITESGISDTDSVLPLLGGTFRVEEGEFEETRTRRGESRVFQQKCWALVPIKEDKEE